MSANKSVNENAMQALRVKYIERLQERMIQIKQLLDNLQNNAASTEDRTALQTHAHSLAGSGATYGFPDITQAARALEESLAEDSPPDTYKPLAKKLMETCQSVTTQASPPPRPTAILSPPRAAALAAKKNHFADR